MFSISNVFVPGSKGSKAVQLVDDPFSKAMIHLLPMMLKLLDDEGLVKVEILRKTPGLTCRIPMGRLLPLRMLQISGSNLQQV
jgi:hypothetical protein